MLEPRINNLRQHFEQWHLSEEEDAAAAQVHQEADLVEASEGEEAVAEAEEGAVVVEQVIVAAVVTLVAESGRVEDIIASLTASE